MISGIGNMPARSLTTSIATNSIAIELRLIGAALIVHVNQWLPSFFKGPFVIAPTSNRVGVDGLAHLFVAQSVDRAPIVLWRKHGRFHLKTHARQTTLLGGFWVGDKIFVHNGFMRNYKRG